MQSVMFSPGMDTGSMAISGFFGIALLWSVGLLTIGFVKALKGNGRNQSASLNEDEVRSFQNLERGFRKMEGRVEALETLLLEKAKEEKFDKLYD